jgi:hypothetical protein
LTRKCGPSSRNSPEQTTPRAFIRALLFAHERNARVPFPSIGGEGTIPERVCQAEAVSLRVFCVPVVQGVVGCFSSVRGLFHRGPFSVLLFSGFVSVVVATGSCDRSLLTRLLPTHSFARYSSQSTVSSSAWHARQMRIYLMRIPHRKGHSIQSIVRPGSVISGRSAASRVPFELAQTGGISSCKATRIEQPGRILVR